MGCKVRSLLLAAAAFVLIAAAAQAQIPPSPLPSPGKPAPAPTDKGNSSSQSVGVVQVGPVTVDPTSAVADTPVADVAGTTEATIGDPGTGNGVSQSGGAVQVGGGNTATGSLGAVQVSHAKAQTTAKANVADAQVHVTAPASIGGSGTNTANGSVVAAQVGSGNTANGATGAVEIKPTTAGVEAGAGAGPLAPVAKAHVAISGDRVLGDTLGISLTELGTYPGSATVFLLNLVHSLLPGVTADAGLQQLVDTGVIQLGGNGDDVRIDLGTVTIQIVSFLRHPHVTLGVLGTQLDGGALVGVPNTGEPTSTDSLGVAQAGGGDTATGSAGVVQVGSAIVAPEAMLHSDELGADAALGGSSASRTRPTRPTARSASSRSGRPMSPPPCPAASAASAPRPRAARAGYSGAATRRTTRSAPSRSAAATAPAAPTARCRPAP